MGKIVIALVALIWTVQVVIANKHGSKFLQQSLSSHNAYRQKHGVPKLELSETLTKVAQEWATKLAAENQMYHRPNNKYGENIYWISSGNVNGITPTKVWYDEIKDYNFDSAEFSAATGHFTQVVWQGSKMLGVGVAKSAKGGGTYVVANYDPPGNYAGEFKANVLQLVE